MAASDYRLCDRAGCPRKCVYEGVDEPVQGPSVRVFCSDECGRLHYGVDTPRSRPAGATSENEGGDTVDVLRALCGEALMALRDHVPSSDKDDEAANELMLRLNQAWRCESPDGAVAQRPADTREHSEGSR